MKQIYLLCNCVALVLKPWKCSVSTQSQRHVLVQSPRHVPVPSRVHKPLGTIKSTYTRVCNSGWFLWERSSCSTSFLKAWLATGMVKSCVTSRGGAGHWVCPDFVFLIRIAVWLYLSVDVRSVHSNTKHRNPETGRLKSSKLGWFPGYETWKLIIWAERKSRLGWPHQGDVVHELRCFRSDMHSCTLWFMHSWYSA